jgi:hypothetical protein
MALPHPFEVRDSNLVALSPPAVTTTRSANSPCSIAHCQQIRQMELFYCYKEKEGSKDLRYDKFRKFLLVLRSENVNTWSVVYTHTHTHTHLKTVTYMD